MTKFTVNKTEISNALSKITGIIENKSSIPVLSNLAFKVGKNELTMSATDMEINALVKCNAVVADEGDFTIPARQFSDICKKSSEDEIHIEVEDGKAKIKSGRSKFMLGTLPIEDFPQFGSLNDKLGFDIDASLLLKLFDDVAISMSDEEARHYLMGAYFHEVDGNLTTVATTGHTLSQSHGEAVEGLKPVIVPRKTVGVMQKLLSGHIGNVRVVSVDNKIQFSFGNLVMISKVVDGKFPDYKRIVPTSYSGSFGFDTQSAIRAIDRLCIIEDNISNSIKITVSKGLLTLDRIGNDENSNDQIEAEYEGDDFVFHINSKYISDVLGKIKNGKSIVKFITDAPHLLFKAENDDSASWVVMQTRGRTA